MFIRHSKFSRLAKGIWDSGLVSSTAPLPTWAWKETRGVGKLWPPFVETSMGRFLCRTYGHRGQYIKRWEWTHSGVYKPPCSTTRCFSWRESGQCPLWWRPSAGPSPECPALALLPCAADPYSVQWSTQVNAWAVERLFWSSANFLANK